ncbi:lysostaphin resistance A-like protein [Pseudomonas sp. NPDC079086]|uniref:CPBP family intramembrane glutamic endopeptidase n=1 Tax=unclassified Pseudomonas TaxID=196821 RepID=UPI0037C96DB4
MHDDLLISNPPTTPGLHWWWYGAIICLSAVLLGDFLAIVAKQLGVPNFLVDVSRLAGTALFLWVFRQTHPTDPPLWGLPRFRHLLGFGFLCWLLRLFWTNGLLFPEFECAENRHSLSGSKPYFFWLTVVVAPVFEEVFFRFFLLRAFPYARSFNWALFSVIFTSLLFSAVHIHYSCAVSFISLFLMGVLFAYARILSGGLALPVLLHAAFNASAFI